MNGKLHDFIVKLFLVSYIGFQWLQSYKNCTPISIKCARVSRVLMMVLILSIVFSDLAADRIQAATALSFLLVTLFIRGLLDAGPASTAAPLRRVL